MKNNIIILGHKNPDVDSIVSGIILSKYLNYKGYNCSYIIPDKNIDHESYTVLKEFGIDCKDYLKDMPGDSNLILVDHHETSYRGRVLAVIDHHPTIKQFNYPFYINKASSSTSKLIYDIIKNEDDSFLTKDIIELIILSMLIDTCSFKSSKTNPVDIPWTKKICIDLNLDFERLKRLGYCLTNLDNPDISCMHGFKEFKYNNKIVKTSYIQCNSFNFYKINKNVEILKNKVINDNIFMWMFLVTDIENEKSLEYRIYQNNIELIEHDFIASRGSNIMPQIEKMINCI